MRKTLGLGLGLGVLATIVILAVPAFGVTNQLLNGTSAPIAPLKVSTSGAKPVYLGIGHHPSFNGDSLDVGVYYEDVYDSSRTIRISGNSSPLYLGGSGYPGTEIQCLAPTPSWSGIGPDTDFAQVILSVDGIGSLTYNIEQENMCNTTPATNLRTNPNNAQFFGTYQLPVGTATLDTDTNMFRVKVTIRYTSAVTSIDDESFGPSSYFRITSSPATESYVATLGTTGSTNSDGIGTRTYTNDREYYTHQAEFGAPCTQVGDVIRQIEIYDPDNYELASSGAMTVSSTQGNYSEAGKAGPLPARPFSFYITENGVRLSSSRYTIVSGAIKIGVDPSMSIRPSGYVTATDRESDPAIIRIAMKPGAKYRLFAQNVFASNFLQIKTPTDAIYNAVDCSEIGGGDVYPVLTPSSPVAIVGQDVSVIPRIHNSNVTFDADARYTYNVWLDSAGDDTYNSGDLPLHSSSIPSTSPPITIGNGSSRNLSADVDTDFTIDNVDYAEICFRLLVQPVAPTELDATQPNPAVTCIPIGKKPHLQVSGGDVISRSPTGLINAPSILMGSNRYGSWGEYAIFGPAAVDMYSGGSLMATTMPTSDDKQRLIFANTPAPGSFGDLGVATVPSLPSWPTVTYGGVGGTATINAGSLPNKTITNRPGNLYLNGSTGLTRQNVLVVDGWVRINGNITYSDGPYSSPAGIPQLIIIADEIRIQPGVSQVDAWLITKGASNTLNTCWTGSVPSPSYFSGLQKNVCTNKLTMNGPIQAGRLLLRRTAGADGLTASSRRAPAEVSNLRADAFLWTYGQASGGGTVRTETIKELPPRF